MNGKGLCALTGQIAPATAVNTGRGSLASRTWSSRGLVIYITVTKPDGTYLYNSLRVHFTLSIHHSQRIPKSWSHNLYTQQEANPYLKQMRICRLSAREDSDRLPATRVRLGPGMLMLLPQLWSVIDYVAASASGSITTISLQQPAPCMSHD